MSTHRRPAAVRPQCAFWMGSTGASTPLHFDAYGYNLVAQVSALPVEPISEHSGARTHARTRARMR